MKPFLTSVSATAAPLAFQSSSLQRRKRIQASPPCQYHCLPSEACCTPFINRRIRQRSWALSAEYADDDAFDEAKNNIEEDKDDEEQYLLQEIARLESLEDLLQDIELDSDFEDFLQENDAKLTNDGFADDVNTLFQLMDDDDDGDDGNDDNEAEIDDGRPAATLNSFELEKALLQGVVPAAAGVGSDCLPGDWGFDPLDFASKDYILNIQYRLLQSLPGGKNDSPPKDRPTALILRDYREAEIRHGRLAMVAAIFWPLQEMLDRLLLDDDQFGPIVYDTVTLPYFPLLMTLFMLNLGYLDIFAKEIQEKDNIGDAYLPGDCFWDPLKFLEGAPPSMKRNMQERELFNGRVAMLAVAAYFFEEVTSGVPIISMDANQLLFIPAYEIPAIQEWLDGQFSPSFN
ncbi:MAG: hypothetical protein SGBAC_010715 [Bacillariaceae sp.]